MASSFIAVALKWYVLFTFSHCSLVVQLGRDLQSDFYPYFESFLEIIVKILNKNHHDVEILEAAFTCLAYLFKFLWRVMIKDMRNVYK